MEESQQEAKAVAKRKADYLNRVQDTRNAQLAQDALVKARVALRTQTRGLELQNTALLLPDGVTPILSDADVPLVPGAVGSDQAAAAMAKNLTNISKVATQGLSDDVANTIQASSKDMSWGPIRLIVQGVEAAYKAFTGSTMGLTKWTEATINVT